MLFKAIKGNSVGSKVCLKCLFSAERLSVETVSEAITSPSSVKQTSFFSKAYSLHHQFMRLSCELAEFKERAPCCLPFAHSADQEGVNAPSNDDD